MNRIIAVLILGWALLSSSAAPPEREGEEKPRGELVFEDQFGLRRELGLHRGEVVLLIFSDRKGFDVCKDLSEKFHILFHPTAIGQPAAKARTAPVAPLQGVPPGKRSPDVVVLPVICYGSNPAVVRDLIRTQLKKSMPDSPVWIDFSGEMDKQFQLKPGQPSFVIFDAQGQSRLRINGSPEQSGIERILQTIQNLRADAAGLGS